MVNNKLILGDNEIVDCDEALYVEGEEVFRLRDSSRSDKPVVDFDLRTSSGDRIAKIANSSVVYAAPGYSYRNTSTPGGNHTSEVVEEATGKQLARVEELSPGTIKVTGSFWVKGYHVQITDQSLTAGGVSLSGNKIQGSGKAIELKRGSLGIGVR